MTNPLPQRPFGRTGLSVSVLGFGSAPIGYLKTDIDRAGKVMNVLLDRGVNLIDTAASYPGSEEAIAKTIGHRRGEFVVVSKCGSKVSGVTGSPWSEELVSQTVDRTLKNLNTDVLDVMLLHSCDLKRLQSGEALAALVKARDAGKIRFLGYSGDNEAAAYAATLPDIAVLETSVNLADQANLDAALPAAREHNVGVLAKRPVANAAWKKLEEQQGIYQGYAKIYTERLGQMKLDPAELGFGGEEAWPEIALRFTLAQPGVHSAIIGTTNPENAAKNLDYAAKGPLPQETVDVIRAAFRGARESAGGDWSGQT